MKFSEFCNFQEGYVNPSQKKSEYFGGEIKWLRATDLNNSYVFNTTKTLTREGFESARKSAYLFKPESLAISKSGTIGRLGILKDYMCGNRAVINIEVDETKMNKMYVFYWLRMKTAFIKDLAVGSVQKNLYVSALEKLDIDYKSLSEQHAIAKILATIDEKIEVNNQINKKLEVMAQAIFKHWFVDFEFPNENGEPYKSSGGEMEESELGMIPKGWEVKSVDEIVESISIRHSFNKDEVIFLNTSDVFDGEVLHNNFTKVSTLPGQAKKSIRKRDILYSEIRPKNRRFAYVDFDAEDYVVSTKLMVLRAKEEIEPEIIYFLLTNNATVNELQLMAESRSGTFPQITFNNLKYIKMSYPSNGSLNSKIKVFKAILGEIQQLKRENKSLIATRDTLLPKLMSGEIRVPVDTNQD